MSPSREEVQKKWDQIISKNLDELKEVLNNCVEKQTVILRSHLFAEQIMDNIIRQEFSNPKFVLDKPNLSFFEKLCVVRGLGEFDKEKYDSFILLNKIRNNYAHNLDYELSDQEIKDLGRTLGKEKFNDLNEFSQSEIHLLVLIVHEICKKPIILFSLNKSLETA